jgi:hypothetical protein
MANPVGLAANRLVAAMVVVRNFMNEPIVV